MTADLLRELAPPVLAALTRRYGHFDEAEDATQEALVAAATQWPVEGVPDNPRAWLIRVASRRLIDQLRSEQSRLRREATMAAQVPSADWSAPAADADGTPSDDTLTLLVLCCHPALTPASQIALTLRAVGGLTTAEIARALLVPEATLAQRISRAKHRIKDAGARFEPPTAEDHDDRLRAVLHVLYLIFNEGHTATSGAALQRTDLAAEAIRLARTLHRARPDDAEAAGLLALLLLTHARRAARTGPGGELVPLADQDRSRWDRRAVHEGVTLLTAALARRRPGPYQIQAAIAAAHSQAARAEDTDWPHILGLYELLQRLDDNPVVTLNRAVATAMVHGPEAGLALLDTVDADPRMTGNHRVAAVRAHLLHRAGDPDGAVAQYRAAAERTASVPERDYLLRQAGLADGMPGG
ncbi:sigma-70 family RNA polymerase sigma factor [Micromonospora sp. C31]|uniref:RNA polymerase sigma factor n=1 Tax=Micromonospora sp. C31 TaxID=2824876 RepID=UPI001B37CEAC|nr:sigma-70 family RNA polymerase sigma factor [Micromonospora sp. C31]MBQ1075665.1 sigma-70 family RNA polymerase sigma factor [Micromonospora sp. C31]